MTEATVLLQRLFQAEPTAIAQPYTVYREIRAQTPVLWAEGPGKTGAWHLFDYASVLAAFRDRRLSARRDMGTRSPFPPGVFEAMSDEQRAQVRYQGAILSQMMLTLDPPDHTRLRKLVAAAFTPRMIETLRERIQKLVDQLLDAASQQEIVDIVGDFAYPLPTTVIAELLGVPAEDREQFKHWSSGLISVGQSRSERAIITMWEMTAYFRRIIAERRDRPQSDLISALVAARDQNDILTEDEIIAQCHLLLVAGHETTTYAIGSSVLTLLRHPAAWQLLGEHPEQIEAIVEELLRYESPFQFIARKALEPLEIGSHLIRPGEYVWLWIGSANRDAAQFSDPDALNFSRSSSHPLAHLAFGNGIHYCLGAALARLELQTALLTLRQRYPSLQLLDEEILWREGLAIRGPKRLRVFLAPNQR